MNVYGGVETFTSYICHFVTLFFSVGEVWIVSCSERHLVLENAVKTH